MAPAIGNLKLQQALSHTYVEDYWANIGIISFDPSPMIKRKLKQFNADPCIKSYGIDRLMTLCDSPFN